MSSAPTTSSSSNPRYGSIPEQQNRRVGLHRALSGRHIQMIAIGGTIGTGLFLGGPSLASTSEPDTLGMGIEREDAEGEEPFETCSEGSNAVSNASAGARNPGGSERGTAGTFPPTREEDDLPPRPPTGLTKNRRKKKSKKGKKQILVPGPIIGLPSQQVEEHYPSPATPTEEPSTSPEPRERSRNPPNKGKRMDTA